MLLMNDLVLHVSDVSNVEKKWKVLVLLQNFGTVVWATFQRGE